MTKRFAVAGLAFTLALGGVVLADEKALKELEGTYKVTAAEKGGVAAPKGEVDFTVTIKGDEMTVKTPNGEKKAKIKVDPTKTPAHIDLSPTDGPEKGKTFPGLYKLEKGELTIVFAEGDARPKGLKAEGEEMMIKMKKEAK
jgi:uncharacterized protein (TIGR03067 family)